MNLYEYEEKLKQLKESMNEYSNVKRELKNEEIIFDEISRNECMVRNQLSSIGEEICSAIRCNGFNNSIMSAIDYSQSSKNSYISEKAKENLYDMQYEIDKKIYMTESEIEDVEKQIYAIKMMETF